MLSPTIGFGAIALIFVRGVSGQDCPNIYTENVCQMFYNFKNPNQQGIFDVVNWLPDNNGLTESQQVLEESVAGDICNATELFQPHCHVTCDVNSDKYFIDVTGLQDKPHEKPNTKSLGDVVGQEKLDEIVCSFGDFTPMSYDQRHCALNYWKNGEDPDLRNASYTLWYGIGQFAPHIVDPDNNYDLNSCDQQLGSVGLFYDPDFSEVLSVCNPNSPGKQWNDYLENGNYTSLFETCGYEFVNNYFSDITQGIGCYGILTAGLCQTCPAAAGGNHDACYCVLEEAQGLHCPMFGPIYYMNQRIVYQVGGLDYLKAMPGSRVKCDKAVQGDDCAGMCEPKCLCDYDLCSEDYNCSKKDNLCTCEDEHGNITYESYCNLVEGEEEDKKRKTKGSKNRRKSKSSKMTEKDTMFT